MCPSLTDMLTYAPPWLLRADAVPQTDIGRALALCCGLCRTHAQTLDFVLFNATLGASNPETWNTGSLGQP